MGMKFAPTWLRQVSPLLHKTTLTTDRKSNLLVYVCYIMMLYYVVMYIFSHLYLRGGVVSSFNL